MRYRPTPDEVASLTDRGWHVDEDGWWWPNGEGGGAWTYREAVREADRRDREEAPRRGGKESNDA